MNDSEDTSELRNPFPSPPSHYALYTSHNLRLLSLLKERDPESINNNQSEILSDQNEVPDWPLTQLEKPRVDWIIEEPDAYYEVFGDRWFVRQHFLFKSTAAYSKLQVKEKIPSLEELGGNQLYPSNPTIGKAVYSKIRVPQ